MAVQTQKRGGVLAATHHKRGAGRGWVDIEWEYHTVRNVFCNVYSFS
jgi:hypothetical protein